MNESEASGSWSPAMPVDAASIRRLVERFYQRVRADDELGPVFNDAVHDWPEHLETLTGFWRSVMLGEKRYHGRPVPAHFRHRARMAPHMFARWLALWRMTAQEIFAPEDAAAFVERAEMIARSLQYALYQELPPRPPHMRQKGRD
ncbi:group III truncated hemoglobin [Camelimonas abortus]|uniref:Group III truncated hemoglobin n=1 Tax=Camelimonas abortus TaxID=1017184 RepID=A0ABV7LG56_9HYPH